MKLSRGTVVISVVAFMFLLGLGLFLPAGTIIWLEGWVYLIIFTIYSLITVLYLNEKDPELARERRKNKFKAEQKWDQIIVAIVGLAFIPWFIIPGFDAVRFQWSIIPVYIKIIGFVGIILSFALLFQVTKTNSFAARIVKIQEEKEHRVITTGPYKYIRHPMYTACLFLIISHSLALGSFYSLIPGIIINIALIARTKLEDNMLKEKLVGYLAYSQKTKFKLVPGIW